MEDLNIPIEVLVNVQALKINQLTSDLIMKDAAIEHLQKTLRDLQAETPPAKQDNKKG